MKIQLETFSTSINSSFHLMYNPRLSDLFYWHFHPEYELVYIEGTNGNRHVGDHISSYFGSDLVLIGSNIPHLNFDFGVQSDYQKVVAHIKLDFVTKVVLSTPELISIAKLFERSKYGIVFNGAIKQKIGQQLISFEGLDPFQQFIQLIQILKQLSETETQELLHDQPYVNRYKQKEQERIRTIYSFIDKHYHQKIELEQIAQLSNLSKEAFCRYFKKTTGNTFIHFLNQYRISQAKRMLMSGKSISEACYSCGFESLPYFSRTFKKVTAENPSTFKSKYV